MIHSEATNCEARSDEEKAKLFNSSFASVVTDDDYEYFEPPSGHRFGSIQLESSEAEIGAKLERLHPNKSRGNDEIPPIFLKKTFNVVVSSLKNLFANIKRLRKFPSEWKIGIVSPIFKDNDRKEVSNYRPVTLLNIVSKLFEKFMFGALMKAFGAEISNYQCGFRTKRSVVVQLLYSLTQIYKMIGSAHSVNFLDLFDFSKAFDKIKHSQLLRKLLHLDFSEGVFELVRDYLSGRTQKVKINNVKSEPLVITAGVPQGSVLGPLLFLIYINDLPNVVFSSLALLFADDLKMIFNEDDTSVQKLQEDINNLHYWSAQNHLLFNSKKCSVTEFKVGNRPKTLNQMQFMFGNNPIESKDLAKDVGLIVNRHLNWGEHAKHRVGKAVKSLFLLRRNTSMALPQESKVHLYRAILSPILLFSSECWELRKSEYQIMESLHKKAMRWICGSIDYKDAILKSNLLPPTHFKVLKDLFMFRSLLSGKYDVEFSEIRVVGEDRRKRVALPEAKYEVQRLNFWYRTGFRVNVFQKVMDFFCEQQLKRKLIEYMWSYLERNCSEQNPCTWTFNCICENCRAHPRT